MGVCLTDQANEENFLLINFWNWRPTVSLVGYLIQPDEADPNRLERLAGGAGVDVSADEAKAIARFLLEQVLPNLGENGRILLDGSVTNEPDVGTLYSEPHEQWRNYSVQREWLEKFAQFCQSCQGFSAY